MSEGDAAEMKAKIVDRVGSRLELDEAQKAKLGILADKLREQRNALVGSTTNPRAEIASLVAGSTFDRAKATALVGEKTGAITSKEPRGDHRDGRLLRQPAARAADQGARVHGKARAPWLAPLKSCARQWPTQPLAPRAPAAHRAGPRVCWR